jgi:DNA-binding transcriptional LysR family regulator
VEAVVSGRGGTARVGAVTGGAVAFMVPAIQQLRAFAAASDIHVDVAPSDVLIPGLLRGDYDFVLARVPAGQDTRELSILPGRVEVIRFMVNGRHPLAGRQGLRIADLAGFEWVIQALSTPMRQTVEEAFTSHGIALPSEIVNTTSLVVMIAYLLSSRAIAPISHEVAELLGPSGLAGNLRQLDLVDPIVVNPYYLITRRDQVISPVATRLHELVLAALAAAQTTAN